MKLIVRADDFGITDGVTWGALRAMREGIATSTGVMTNMPSSVAACEQARLHSELCFGQDINIATGRCVAPIGCVQSMVTDEKGTFRRSPIIRNLVKCGEEPFPYREVRSEVEAQLARFEELVGRKPAYLNGHAFRSPNFSRALSDVADEHGIVCMDRIVERFDLESLGFAGSARFAQGWYRTPFTLDTQLKTDAEAFFIEHFDELLGREYSYIICHPGYIDADLMTCSSLNLVRMRDLQMCVSPHIRELLERHGVELMTISEFCEEQGYGTGLA